ncbi:ABC transporter ATP-binding protein [Kitasatospora sp. NPDC058965]|uniref:ABC transporter ATP-binding protein n=1 Tax=Kitasatospora sp. NPDC058965 TaxID=3346682 RepID=UPI003688364C
MGDTVLGLEQLHRTYGTGPEAVHALAGVDVGFARGTFTAVMGPSGSGKSTLLQCAAGLDRPDSGRVVLDGVELGRLTETQLTVLRRDLLGFVFQAFNLVGSLTAEQNVGLPLRLAGRRPDRAEVEQALAQVGLGHRTGHLPSQLSGGQQQRVAIARALITRPKVLFADEPTGALDSSSSRDVLALLRSLVDQEGQTTVMVTHDPVAAAHADRVLFLADGRLVDDLAAPTAQQVAERMTTLETAPGATTQPLPGTAAQPLPGTAARSLPGADAGAAR